MKRNANRGFDEVMIVNPYDPTAAFGQGETLMPYHYGDPSGMGYYGNDPYGYYAQPAEVSGWGEPQVYGEPDHAYGDYETVGYYAEPEHYGYYADPAYGYYAQPEHYGYYAEPEHYGYYAEPEHYGYYAEPGYAAYEPMGYYGDETVGYHAEPEHYGYYADPGYGAYEPVGYYAAEPEMVGYGAEPFEYPGADYYGDSEFAGYVKDAAPAFNAGCPVPSNVAGLGAAEPLEGYVRPGEVSPSCGNFTPQPGPTAAVPDTFRPLWE